MIEQVCNTTALGKKIEYEKYLIRNKEISILRILHFNYELYSAESLFATIKTKISIAYSKLIFSLKIKNLVLIYI